MGNWVGGGGGGGIVCLDGKLRENLCQKLELACGIRNLNFEGLACKLLRMILISLH